MPASFPRLLLASASPRRRELLGRLGLPFAVVHHTIGEAEAAPDNLPPEALAEALALAKARSAPERPEEVVLAADTLVVREGRILGKPQDAAEARAMLRTLRGREHRVISGVALVLPLGKALASHETTTVWMRDYSEEEIEKYVASADPLDKAGAYAIQHPGFHPVARYQGCYLNVVGLPLCAVARLLRQAGVAEAILPRVLEPGACSFCPNPAVSSGAEGP